MTKIEAIRLLRDVWGSPCCISEADSARLSALAKPGENLFQTCSRIAGIDTSTVQPFDFYMIRRLVADAEQSPGEGPEIRVTNDTDTVVLTAKERCAIRQIGDSMSTANLHHNTVNALFRKGLVDRLQFGASLTAKGEFIAKVLCEPHAAKDRARVCAHRRIPR